MREELLPYYQRELTFIRQMAAEFAEKYPKVAGRLMLTQSEPNPAIGIPRLTEYQFAGDCEAHGIPSKP